MVPKILAALLVALALTGSARVELVVPSRATTMADGSGLPKCC